jgi:heptosyltransferase-1
MNIAIVKLSSLGDVVHALPVAAALRAHLPRARVTWVVERREAAVLRGNPAIDEVAVADTRAWRRRRGLKAGLNAARDVRMLFRVLRQGRFDVALDLQGNLKSGIITAVTRASLRVAPPPAAHHVVDQYLALLGALGVAAAPARFWLPADPDAADVVERFFAARGLKAGQPLVALNPGAGQAAKRWAVASFAELARRLRAELGATALVVWGPAELEQAQAIVDGAGPAAAILAPATDLHALVALLRRSRAMVAADTGPLHLAAALGIACVGLYGPTDPARNGPYGEGHRTIRASGGAMQTLPVEPVLHAVAELLD